MDIVQDVDRAPADPYHLGVGITFRPVVGIDIHGGGTASSMFQSAATSLRAILDINWAMRRSGAVAWMAGVTW